MTKIEDDQESGEKNSSKMIEFPARQAKEPARQAKENESSNEAIYSFAKSDSTRLKIKTFEEWMAGDHALIHFDSRHQSVIVPAQLKNNPILTLKLSYLFNGKTSFDENEISSFLKFSGNYFECVVPWDTIWAISSEHGEQKIWEESFPKDQLVESPIKKNTEKKDTVQEVPSTRPAPTLKRVK